MELEQGYVMGLEVNNFTLGGGLESILEGIGDIHYADGEVIGGSDKKNSRSVGADRTRE